MSLTEMTTAAVSRTELRRMLDRAREATGMPLDLGSQAGLARVHAEMRELHHRALGHPVNPATGRRECPGRVCLHERRDEPGGLLRTAELAERASEILDNAAFRYRWRRNQNPDLPGRMTRLYASRRPHLAAALRYGANRIRRSLR